MHSDREYENYDVIAFTSCIQIITVYCYEIPSRIQSEVQDNIGQKLQTTTKEGKTAKVQDNSKSTEKVLILLVITVQDGHRK